MLSVVTLRAFILCLVVTFCVTPSQAESIFMSLSNPDVSFGRRLPDGQDAAFYRSWAQPVRGAPINLGAGQWTLETDRKTRLAYPRLVALANRSSVTRANAALEAMHGRILKTAYRANSLYARTPFGELDTGRSFAVQLWAVKVTYLSSNTLSLVAVGEQAHEGNGGNVLVRGAAVDVARGTIFTINSCHEERERPFFTFGPLLTICDDHKLEAFRALWREQARIVQRQARVVQRVWPWQNTAQEDCRAMVPAYIDDANLFSLYLTPTGLAVHNAFSSGGWEGWCYMDPDSPFFPVVIPWPKLARLMNSGPLRDELLALSTPLHGYKDLDDDPDAGTSRHRRLGGPNGLFIRKGYEIGQRGVFDGKGPPGSTKP